MVCSHLQVSGVHFVFVFRFGLATRTMRLLLLRPGLGPVELNAGTLWHPVWRFGEPFDFSVGRKRSCVLQADAGGAHLISRFA